MAFLYRENDDSRRYNPNPFKMDLANTGWKKYKSTKDQLKITKCGQ